MQIKPSIFKQYDIRGIWGKELLADTAYQIGLGMGTFFAEKNIKTIAVGRDNRTSGEVLLKYIIQGLIETGRDVVNLGLSTSPLIYASWYLLDINGTVNITASHNPAEYNGFKAAVNKTHFSTDEYQQIKEHILHGSFKKTKHLGAVTTYNLWPEYLKRVTKDISLSRPVKVVLDCGNGTCSTSTDKALEKIGCQVIRLFCSHDGSFPHHLPYPQREDLYAKLRQTILREKADMGIAMDGDGDRFGVYDEQGRFVSDDLIGALIAGSMIKEHPGLKTVFNISASKKAIEYIENKGGNVELWKTGYPFIIAKMKEIGALMGNEIAGHFFLRDTYYGFDDATYAALRFVELFSQQKKTVSQLIEEMPPYIGTPEFRVLAPDEPKNNKCTIIKKLTQELREKYPKASALDFDGIRMNFPDKSWLLLRNSNTEPLITGRVEAKTPERLHELKQELKSLLKRHSVSLDWDHPIAKH